MFALLATLVVTVPMEDPGPPAVPPEIAYCYAEVMPDSVLSVEGTVTDEDLPGLTVRISWLDDVYEVSVDSLGNFWWQIGMGPGDEGFLTVVAVDSGGLESEPWEDLILPF